jgi:hypothetical protein
MRALLAAALALFLAVVALAPHAHTGSDGSEDCSACVASGRHAAPVPAVLTGAPPPPAVRRAFEPYPAGTPTSGAPLGAVPGQSPPRA